MPRPPADGGGVPEGRSPERLETPRVPNSARIRRMAPILMCNAPRCFWFDLLNAETPKVPNSAPIRRMEPIPAQRARSDEWFAEADRLRAEADRAFEALRKLLGEAL